MSTARRTAARKAPVTWQGRVQIVLPDDGVRGVCSGAECERELCYCERCVVPDSWAQVALTMGGRPYCHEDLEALLGWGPGRRLHHCSTCTCVEE